MVQAVSGACIKTLSVVETDGAQCKCHNRVADMHVVVPATAGVLVAMLSIT
jgi:hypothetical protein